MTPQFISAIWCSLCGQVESFDLTIVEWPFQTCDRCSYRWDVREGVFKLGLS